MSVVVVDYGIGNVHSVLKALERVGAEATLSADPEVVVGAGHLVLPGVGAFADGMAQLRGRGLVEPIRDVVAKGTPILGICLGMQMLLEESAEFGTHPGLGFVPGRVERIPVASGWKVPHVGWNTFHDAQWNDPLLRGLETAPPSVYFVHSFHACPIDEHHLLATVRYGGAALCAAVRKQNIVGFQFHPEKSGPVGLELLRRFVTS